MAPLHDEINKQRPFDDPAVEAALNIERTAALFRAQLQRLLRPHSLSPAGYNVLRILRGHSPNPRDLRPCTPTQIKADMITPVPDLTRLVDRLAADGLVERLTCPNDARAVHIALTAAGRRLLASLDNPVQALHAEQLGHLSNRELAQISRLLCKARSGATTDAADD
ncbi:MAG: MarR family transcriptional regulator [Phycisphaerales bacterium]|nr:MarR family transcriptional regulator [Phycisphaerales bacterium]